MATTLGEINVTHRSRRRHRERHGTDKMLRVQKSIFCAPREAFKGAGSLAQHPVHRKETILYTNGLARTSLHTAILCEKYLHILR